MVPPRFPPPPPIAQNVWDWIRSTARPFPTDKGEWFVYINPSQNKKGGEHGTMTATRHEPLSVSYGIGVERHDMEGRVIVLE